MQDNEEQLIKKMANLLREGATMLDKVCPKCNTIIYKLPGGKIICPKCNSEIIIQKKNEMLHTGINTQISPSTYDFSSLLEKLVEKINDLGKRLSQETDYLHLEKLIGLIEKLIDLYVKLTQMNPQKGKKQNE